MFNVCGLAGVLYAVPIYFLLRDAREPAEARLGAARPSPVLAFRQLLGNASFRLLVLYFTLPAMAGWIVRDWMPAILKTEFGIGQGQAGVSATLYWMLAAVVAALGGGWLADRWMKHSNRGRIYTSAIGMALIVASMAGVGLAPQTGQLSLAVLSLVVFGAGFGFFDVNNMPILCQIVRPPQRAFAYGVMNTVSISFGGVADWGFGVSRDAGIPLPVTFTVVAAVSFISLWMVLLIRPIYDDASPAPIGH